MNKSDLFSNAHKFAARIVAQTGVSYRQAMSQALTEGYASHGCRNELNYPALRYTNFWGVADRPASAAPATDCFSMDEYFEAM